MTTYIKKPVAIEAYQITKKLLSSIIFGEESYPIGLHFLNSSGNATTQEVYDWNGNVVTIHGQETRVTIGDWIIAEPDGVHFYPCKPDIFKATYYTQQEYIDENT